MNSSAIPCRASWSLHTIPVLGLFLAVVIVYVCSLPLGVPLYSLRDQVLTIQDFAFYFNCVRSFWFRTVSGLYSGSDIRQALHGLLGAAPPAVLPNPMSPTAIVIWLPLVVVAGHSIAVACWMWMVISLMAFCGVVRSVCSRVVERGWTSWAICAGCLLALISNVGQRTAVLGQSSLFAAAVIGYLAFLLARDDSERPSPWMLAVLLFLASIKLPYLVVGLGLLIVERRWAAIGLCAALFLGCFVIGAVWGTPEWMSGYMATIGRYVSGSFSDREFYMADFQANSLTWERVASRFVSPSFAIVGQWFGRGVGVISMLSVFCLRDRIATPLRVELSLRLLLGTYLIFSSYLGYYEQLLLVLCPLVSVVARPMSLPRALASFLLVYVALSDAVFPPVISFMCKVLVFFV